MKKFGILSALKFYQEMMEFDGNTRAHDVASYIMNEAIFADISSIYYLKYPACDVEFSSYELHLMIESGKSLLLKILLELKALLNSSEVDFIAVKIIYESYCTELEKIVSCCQASRSQMASDLAQVQGDDETELPLVVDQLLADVRVTEIWRQIIESNIERLDVFGEWPLNEIQRQYLLEIIRILPTEVNLLVRLYRGINPQAVSSDFADKFDKLRLMFISEAIKIFLYWQHYYSLYQSQQCNVQEAGSNKKLPFIFKQNNNFVIACPIAPHQVSLEKELQQISCLLLLQQMQYRTKI